MKTIKSVIIIFYLLAVKRHCNFWWLGDSPHLYDFVLGLYLGIVVPQFLYWH